jgi:cytochrome c-type biogenesis protein CcmH
MKRFFLPGVILLAFAFAVFFFSGVSAQQPTPSDDEVNAIAKQLYCPVCENTPLDVCPTTACQQWRDLIRQKLTEGQSEQQIKDYFAAYYGDRVLAKLPARGANILLYVLPPVLLLAGAFILFTALRKPKNPKEGQPAPPAPGKGPAAGSAAEDEYLRRMEEELRRRE